MLVLYDIEGYQHNKIAAILGCITGALKSQLHNARVLMCEQLTTSASGQWDDGSQPLNYVIPDRPHASISGVEKLGRAAELTLQFPALPGPQDPRVS